MRAKTTTVPGYGRERLAQPLRASLAQRVQLKTKGLQDEQRRQVATGSHGPTAVGRIRHDPLVPNSSLLTRFVLMKFDNRHKDTHADLNAVQIHW